MASTTRTTAERAEWIDEQIGTWVRRRRHIVGPPLLAVDLFASVSRGQAGSPPVIKSR